MNYKFKLKKGDEVIVLAGKDKGKTGKIVKMIPKQLKAIALIVDPSSPTRTDFICFSFMILLLIGFTFSIINFGSGLPDPKGDKLFTLLKNSKFISGIFKTKHKVYNYLVGSILTSGLIINWFINNFNIKNYSELNKLLTEKNIAFKDNKWEISFINL